MINEGYRAKLWEEKVKNCALLVIRNSIGKVVYVNYYDDASEAAGAWEALKEVPLFKWGGDVKSLINIKLLRSFDYNKIAVWTGEKEIRASSKDLGSFGQKILELIEGADNG